MRSHIEIAVKWSKRIEFILCRKFGAKGRGLHQKVSSVKEKLPILLTRKIRYIATIRNKIVHDRGFNRIRTLKHFLRTCRFVETELYRRAGACQQKGWRGWLLRALSF